MSKKQLLNESEIRRFMKLANIEPLGRNVVKENFLEEAPMGADEEPKAAEYELEEVYGEDSPEGDEELELGEPGGEAGGGDKEAKFLEAMKALADMAGVEIDASQESGEEAGDEMEQPAEDEEAGEEEGEDEDEEEEAGGEDELEEEESAESGEEQNEQQLQEALVQRILSRVTNRLVNEAAKAKKNGQKVLKGEKKKKGIAAKMAEKKKKLKEANAPAPKATNSNGPKKGAGSATKGNWGVTSKVADQEWKEGKAGKGGHELETVSASAEHTHTHGKNNLATKGKK